MDGPDTAPTGRTARQTNGAKAAKPTDSPVIVAVGLSQASEAAVIWACDYAATVGAPIEVLHVVHDPPDSPGSYRSDGDDPLEPMTDKANRKLVDFLERIGSDNPGLPGLDGANLLCVPGLPAAKIIDVARLRGARLLVLGGGHRNGLGRFLRGSTAHQVARHAPIPVTLVKAGD